MENDTKLHYYKFKLKLELIHIKASLKMKKRHMQQMKHDFLLYSGLSDLKNIKKKMNVKNATIALLIFYGALSIMINVLGVIALFFK